MPRTRPAPNLLLQRERFRKQMTRSALADQTGVSRKALLDIEKRRTRVRLDTAGRIAQALECGVEDIFDVSEVIG